MDASTLEEILEDLAEVVNRIDAVSYGHLPHAAVVEYMEEVRGQAADMLRLVS